MHEQTHYKIARNYAQVGAYLLELRKKAHLTQREVADHLGYSSAQFISNFERGIALPPLKKMKALQELYRGNVNRIVNLTLDCEKVRLADALQRRPKGKSH